jgi:hypothetical protein
LFACTRALPYYYPRTWHCIRSIQSPQIAEKAYAKLHGSYAAIIGGKEPEALQDMTSGVPITIEVADIGKRFSASPASASSTGTSAEDALWRYLQDRMGEGGLLGASKSSHHPGRASEIMEKHAYGILRLDVMEEEEKGQEKGSGDSTGERVVQIRNPWGSGLEWGRSAGQRYGDSDPLWNNVSAAKKEAMGYSVGEDGTWWMPFQDLLREFDEVDVSRNMHGWTTHRVVGHWKGNTAAGADNEHLCPQVR